MGEQLIQKMIKALGGMEWPQNPHASQQGRQTFLVGLEKLDSYLHDSKALSSALRTFQTGDSLPYAYGGVAYTLVVGSRESDNSFSQTGLTEAMKWLEQAQDAQPDILEINVIEAMVYTYSGRFDDARLVLDYLQGQDPNNYYLLKAEVAYWKRQDDMEQAIYWFNKAAESAENVPQRLRVRAQLGNYYMENNQLDEALTVFKEAAHFDKNNVQLWHKISVIHWRQEEFGKAEQHNEQVLRLQKDYPPGLKMKEAIKRKKLETGRLGRFFGGS